jgi:predicted nucleotidyltransferase
MTDALSRELSNRAWPGVVAAYIFGSYAGDRAHLESDVDVGVLLRYDRYPSARTRFEERVLLSSALSAALRTQVDVVILNDAPPTLGRRIVTSGVRVFSADPEREHAFIRDVQLRAADLEPFLRRMRALKLQALVR